MHETDKFLATVEELCKQEIDGFTPISFVVQESDVTTVIIARTYADEGILLSHNAWYGQEVSVIDLMNLPKGKQHYNDLKEADIFKAWIHN